MGARNKEVLGLKRPRPDYMDEDPAEAEELLNQINNEYQFPRILSSRRLLDLEVFANMLLSVNEAHQRDRWRMLDLGEVSLFNI